MNAIEILQACKIPSVPVKLHEILKAANDPSTTSSRLEKLVLQDAGLSMHLLKTVNSSLYFRQQAVKSLSQAIVMLGFPTVRSIASGLVMLETFSRMKALDQKHIVAVWDHSLATAKLVSLLSQGAPPKRRDELFLAAMLHDVGHLILSLHFGADYRPLIEQGGLPSPAVERERFGVDHAQIGGELLREWQFSDAVRELTLHHHDVDGFTGDQQSLHCIRAADLLEVQLTAKPAMLELEAAALPVDLSEAIRLSGGSWNVLKEKKPEILASMGSSWT